MTIELGSNFKVFNSHHRKGRSITEIYLDFGSAFRYFTKQFRLVILEHTKTFKPNTLEGFDIDYG